MNYSFLSESVWHPPLFFEEDKTPPLPPELELQALWFGGALGREFRLKDGRSCKIVQFGEWNMGAGPDFSHAAIEIDGCHYTGDIEIDSSASDWEAHGHANNPAFTNTIVHVSFEASTKEHFIATANHRQVPEILITPTQLSDALQLPARDIAISVPGRCITPLKRMPHHSLERLLKEAALHRAERKAARFLKVVDAHNFDTALFQATADTLGYGGNSLPMKLLAQRAPISLLRSQGSDAEAILLGTAGFLDTRIYENAPPETREYLQNLWETWWRIRPKYEAPASRHPQWKTHGQRPANHPHRRVGGLSSLIKEWSTFRSLALASPFAIKPVADFLHGLRHEFWSRHHTLTSAKSSQVISTFGKNLALELCANHLIPLALHEDRFTFRAYAKQRHSASNQKLKRCGIRLFGSEKDSKPFSKRLYHQQALLQLYQDFCLEDTTECAECPFPEQLGQWR